MTTNIAASIRQRLHNYSKTQKDEFQLVLTRYALQRLVYRLTLSAHSDRFVLKGAMLFTLWADEKYRATRDLDLLGSGDAEIGPMEQVFKDICAISSPDDGITFLADTVKGEPIREGEEYEGIRITLTSKIEQARIPIQVDIGFGDAITPAAKKIDYPNILGLSAASIKCYPRETVVAEKFQAMCNLGMANSRLKDFYDVWFLAMNFSFEGKQLAQAIQNTFSRRKTPIPQVLPIALSKEFYDDATKQKQWKAFLIKAKVAEANMPLSQAVKVLDRFTMLPVEAITHTSAFTKTWRIGGPWE
jgi:hypothetical protein